MPAIAGRASQAALTLEKTDMTEMTDDEKVGLLNRLAGSVKITKRTLERSLAKRGQRPSGAFGAHPPDRR